MAEEIDPQGRELEELLAAADFDNARVLEVGCGEGRLTFLYGNTPAFIVGLDPRTQNLVSALEVCPSQLRHRLNFIQSSAMDMPFCDDSFDIVLFAKSL